jgi:hypothetical protein
MNVLIHTNDPTAVLEKTMALIQLQGERMVVGYRKFAEDDYTPMFPSGWSAFRVS